MKSIMLTLVAFLSLTALAEDNKNQIQQQQQVQQQQQQQEQQIEQMLQQQTVQSQQQQVDASVERDYGYGYGVGPGRTLRWQMVDSSKAPKIIDENVSIRLNGRLVNEVLFRAEGNPIDVSNAVAYLSNGQVIDLYAGSGMVRDGEVRRFRLDYRYSFRVERIELTISSPRLIGSRGLLTTYIGFAD